MPITLMKNIRCFASLVIVCVLLLVNGASLSEASVNGMLRQVGNHQILNLWGNNYEMGYAHGFLMADKIRDLVDNFMVGTLAGGNVAVYNDLLAKDATSFQWQQQYLDEINGIVEGIAASGKSRYITRLGRNLDSMDIRALNLQEEFYFGCSSFGVWGTATATGETILARNLDLSYDQQGNNANYQFMIAYEPAGKARFVSFTWPGMVGVYSGINESGVSLFANSGNVKNLYLGPYHPVTEVYRTVLENTKSATFSTQPISVVDSFYELPSEIIQMGASYQSYGIPVYYIEQAPDVNAIRYPVDTEPVYNHIIATNHFMKVAPSPSSGNSVDRYNTIRNGLINFYVSGDKKVDSTEAWELLVRVADVIAPTLTSIIFRPDRMEFDVSFARMVSGNFTSATNIPPQTYAWASLFPNHDSAPDLVIQNIYVNPASPASGQSVAVTVSVNNQGGANAGSYAIDFYRNLSTPPFSRQAGDATCRKSGLAAGAMDSCTFATTFSAVGVYNMWAQVDTDQQVVESNEANNIFGPYAIFVGNSPALSSLVINPASVTGGAVSTGTVTLTSPAPAGGLVVSLRDDSSSSVRVPASVTVANGSTNTSFEIVTKPVPVSKTVTITAAYGVVSKAATIKVIGKK